MTLQSWLTQLCRMIPSVQSALVFDTQEVSEQSIPSAIWPKNEYDYSKISQVGSLLKSQAGPVIILGKSSDEALSADASQLASDTLVIAYPLSLRHFSGVVILEISAEHSKQNVILQILSWGKDWLALLLENATSQVDSSNQVPALKTHATGNESSQALKRYLHIVQLILNCESQYEAYLTLVSEIANSYKFSRVWFAEKTGAKPRVKALSNTASFDARSNLVQSVQEAIGGVKDFSTAQVFTRIQEGADGSALKSKDSLQSLLVAHDSEALLYFPLIHNDETIGILLCESPKASSEEILAEISLLLSLVSPIFALKQGVNKSVYQKVKGRLSKNFQLLAKGRIGKAPLFSASLVILILLASVLQGEHRVASNASLEGRIQRAVVAPFDGYIKQAFIRAGEEVNQGDLIATLDDQELKLEKQRLMSQKEELDKEYRKELVALNQSQIRIIKTQVAQVDVQLSLLKSKQLRTQLLSPLSGIIVEGDLSRAIGSPVKQGQVLFEVAPLNDFRLVLNVDERDIPFLKVGQEGRLMLKAYPNTPIQFRLEQVATVYQQDEGRIWYRSEASLIGADIPLRPGMEGLAKVVVGEKSYLWLGFHRTLDWLRLRLWSWTP